MIWEPPAPLSSAGVRALSPNGNHVLFSVQGSEGTEIFVWSKDSAGVRAYGRIQYVDETTSTSVIEPWTVSNDGRPSATGSATVRPGDGRAWGQAYAWVDGFFSLLASEYESELCNAGGRPPSTPCPSIGLGVSADGSTFTGRVQFPNDGSGQFPNDGSERYYLAQDGASPIFPTPPVGAKFVTAGLESMTADGGMVIGKMCDLFGRNCEIAIWNGSEYIRSGRPGGDGENSAGGVISATGTAAVIPGGLQPLLWTGCPIADSTGMEPLPGLSGVAKVRLDGAVIFAREAGTNQAGIWTPETGFLTYEEAVQQFVPVPEGWTNMTVGDISDDGRVWTGGGMAPDGKGKLWRATLPQGVPGAGKRVSECICTSEELSYTGPDQGSLKFGFNWNTGQPPGSGDNLILPLQSDPYTVLGSESYGALTVDGDVTLKNQVPDVPIELNGLCGVGVGPGNALLVRGRSPTSETISGSRLELMESRAIVNGNILVPSLPDARADLTLTDAGLEGNQPLLVHVGVLGAADGTLHVREGSDWTTEAASAEVGTGTVTLEDESQMVVRDFSLSTTPGDRPLNALLEISGASELLVDSLTAGVENNAWIILRDSDSRIEARVFEAAMEGQVLIDIESNAELSVVRGVLGKRDTAEVFVRSGGFVHASDGLVLGAEAGGVGHLVLASEGPLGQSLISSGAVIVGEEGTGVLDVSEDDGSAAVPTIILGSGKDGEGFLEIRGPEEDGTISLGTALMVIGKQGEGTVHVFGATFDADFDLVKAPEDTGTIILGESREGSGELSLFESSDVSVFTLVVGQAGNGEVHLNDTSDLVATRILLGGSGIESQAGTSPRGVLTVGREATVLAGESICVGCPDGSGLLDVKGFVQTNLLLVGLDGTVKGKVVSVQVVPPGGNKRLAEEGIATEALFLSDGATVEADSLVIGNGTLGGTTTWQEAFTNTGTLSPGNGPGAVGTFTFASDYTQAPGGALVVDLAGLTPGTEHDVLAVQGAVALDGVLRIRRVGAYVPAVGDRYRILTATGGVSGAFASVEAPDLGVSLSYESDGVVAEVVSSVAVEEEAAVPETFALEANYPNPFNPRTRIGYALPEAGHVRLRVFDLYGRLVATLVDGHRAAGRHEVAFDASGLASGTYVYSLEAGAVSRSRRMNLVK